MKDRIEWTRMVSDCITGYRSAKGDADALPPRTFIRAWMNRNFGLQKIPGKLFRLFYRSDKEELNEAFRAGNRARKKESVADTADGVVDFPVKYFQLGNKEDFENFDRQRHEFLGNFCQSVVKQHPDWELRTNEFWSAGTVGNLYLYTIIIKKVPKDCPWTRIAMTIVDRDMPDAKMPFEYSIEEFNNGNPDDPENFLYINITGYGRRTKFNPNYGVELIDPEEDDNDDSNASWCEDIVPTDSTRSTRPVKWAYEYIVKFVTTYITPDAELAYPIDTFINSWGPDFWFRLDRSMISGLLNGSRIEEAFKAGNRARKQESAADIVQSTEDDSPKGQLSRWAAEIVKAVNKASAESNIWTAENFGDNIEIDDAPDEHYYMHRIKVNSWSGCINDFDIDFKNGYAAGYIFIYVPVNPEDGYAFSIGGACDGNDVNESYNIYDTFENAISESIEEIIDCIEYWNKEVTERMSVYDDYDMDEAFRAGNRARKKESVINTTNTVTLSPKQQIKLFMADVKKYRKWLIEQGKGKDFENKDEIWWPGEDFEAPVGIYFTRDNLFEIQDNGIIYVDSGIDFRNYPYEIHLPDKLYCTEAIHFENCDGLIRLPEHLETDEFIILENCKNLRHLPDYLESGGVGVTIINCENLEEIPSGFQLSGDLEIKNCPKINSIPYNLRIYPCEYIEIDLNSPLRKFFDDRKIKYEIKYDAIYIKGRNWEKWQLKHKYITEAFRAGNQARKKESAADTVQGSFEELHYSDIPVLNTQMNRLRDLVSPDDVKNIGGDAIAFGIDIPCDFEFYFNISIYPLEKTGIYSIHVMFTVEGLETYMYDGDEVDSWDLEYVFDRIVDAVEHPEKFEEYRAGGYEKMYG